MTGAATIAFVGDMIFDVHGNKAAAAGRPELVWGDALPVMQGVDAVFGNMENPVSRSEHRWRRTHKPVCHRSDPATISLLTAANFRFVNLANNHALDFEVEGLMDTIAHLDAAGIAHAGAGRDLAAAIRPARLAVAGTSVGVIAITDNTPAFAAGPGRAGTNYLRIDDDAATLARIAGEVRSLRADGARLVVLSAHWGPNLRAWPSARFQRFARAAIDAGVDIFYGHSAHLLQGVERRGDGLILYDVGDLIDDVWWFKFLPYFLGALFLVDLDDGRVRGLRIVPLELRPGRIVLARGPRAQRVFARLARRSPPGGRRQAGTGALFDHVLPTGAPAVVRP
ncbi:MAG TPA: CapA family protein [Vineibacter sp.]|nr:CapA family protein [Vineibacter sp.]